MYVKLAACLLALALPTALGASVEFSYDDQEAWDDLPDSQCGGTSQSPINIMTGDLEDGDDIGLSALVFNYLDQQLYGAWSNNGHSLIFTPASSSEGDGSRTVQTYRGTYELLQFHFHWGENNDEGSEHTVNGKQYSGELHFVHRTTDTDASSTDFDYYTVVGVFLEADEDLDAADTIWESFSTIPSIDEELSISMSNISATFNDLLPSNRQYYYYNGSLTTPLCNQIVQWVVLQDSLSVPSSFFTAARTTEQEGGEALTFNFRDVQALNGRKVYDSPGSVVLPTFIVLALSLIAAFSPAF